MTSGKNCVQDNAPTRNLVCAPNLINVFVWGIRWHGDVLLTANL
jgi:hypothetical protein